MKGRTYRYFGGPVQFPFGFGLGYSACRYEWSRKPLQHYAENESIEFSVRLNNESSFDLQELVQAYIHYPAQTGMPLRELKAFKKTYISKGSEKILHLSIPVSELKKWNEKKHDWDLVKGGYKLLIGKNANEDILTADFTLQ
jgi:beta-glucosidase